MIGEFGSGARLTRCHPILVLRDREAMNAPRQLGVVVGQCGQRRAAQFGAPPQHSVPLVSERDLQRRGHS